MEWVTIATWLVIAAFLTIVGAPLAAAIFERLPGNGAPFSMHLSLVVIGLVSFWVGHLRYGWVALGGALVVLVALSATLYHRGYRPTWGHLTEGYLVFLGGFTLALAVRVTDTTIRAAGGEQFLHFGLLNAVERATALPPQDMWWAGESVNYYYGGHVLVDQLARLTGTEPRLAYNLGLAVVFGLAAAAAFGLVGAVVDRYGYSRRVGGAVGAATLLLAGTFATPVRLLIAQLPESIATRVGEFAFYAVPSADPLPEVIAGYASLGEWSWWFERRVVDGTLVETPLFSMVKADLHGHVTTIPFMILLIAVAFAYYQTPAQERVRRWALLVLVFPALAGMVGWMNTWSLPGAIGIAWLALAFARAHPLSLLGERFERDIELDDRGAWIRSEASRLGAATAGAAGVGLIGGAWIAPFLLFQLPSNDGIGFLPDRSPFAPHALLWGAFFLLFILFLALALWRRYDVADRRAQVLAIGSGAVLLGGILLVVGWGSFAIALPVAIIAWWLLRREPSIGFIGVLIVGTLGLILAMELVYADVWPPERQRLNTTYKVSMQAMTFGLLSVGAIVTVLISEQIATLRDRVSLSSLGIVSIVVVVVLLLGTFPVLTLGGEFGDFAESHPDVHYSIDALDGHDRWNADEMEAIYWLDSQPGDPVILEAPGEQTYTWSNPASTFTGIPTVLGWAHERGYRGVEAYYERQDLVDDIYNREFEGFDDDDDRAVALLQEFDVDYIWVGEAERERYGASLRDFFFIDGISAVFENEDVTIYQVDLEDDQ